MLQGSYGSKICDYIVLHAQCTENRILQLIVLYTDIHLMLKFQIDKIEASDSTYRDSVV